MLASSSNTSSLNVKILGFSYELNSPIQPSTFIPLDKHKHTHTLQNSKGENVRNFCNSVKQKVVHYQTMKLLVKLYF